MKQVEMDRINDQVAAKSLTIGFSKRRLVIARYLSILFLHDFLFEIDVQSVISASQLKDIITLLSEEGEQNITHHLDTLSKREMMQRVECYQNHIALSLISTGSKVTTPDMVVLIMILDFFHKSNDSNRRLDAKDFSNEALSDHLDMNIISTQYYNYRKKPATLRPFLILDYPWLFTTEAKVDVLQVENACTQNSQMFSQISEGISGGGGLFNMLSGQNMHLAITVRRDNILEDALNKLNNQGKNLKKPLKVAFAGEAGVDAGGLRKEFFQLLTKELFNPNYTMFVTKNVGRGDHRKGSTGSIA